VRTVEKQSRLLCFIGWQKKKKVILTRGQTTSISREAGDNSERERGKGEKGNRRGGGAKREKIQILYLMGVVERRSGNVRKTLRVKLPREKRVHTQVEGRHIGVGQGKREPSLCRRTCKEQASHFTNRVADESNKGHLS